jgi:tRNA-binding EMAP/Myf-like protein
MKLYTKNTGSNYLAKVVKLGKVWKHPQADRLQLTSVDNQTVVVGLNARETDEYIFFPLEAAINKKFLAFTNSFSDPLLNSDGKTKGFFNDKGRVKAVKLRGTPSEGYLVPIKDFLAWIQANPAQWAEGDWAGTEFDSVEYVIYDGDLGTKTVNELVCEKYVPFVFAKGPANTPKQKKELRHNRIIPGQFHFHVDTAQLKKNVHMINPSDTITITEKLHGTSVVISNVLVNRKLKWYEKLLKRLGVKIQDKEYDMVYSSRSVIKNAYEVPKTHNHFYKEDVWGLAAKRVYPFLKPGMTAYAEIVGYTPNGTCIQKGYDYGCEQGDFDVYIYRMTQVDPLGNVLELTTNQIKRFVDSTGTKMIKMVPIHYHGQASDYTGHYPDNPEDLERFRSQLLTYLTDEHLEKPCQMCKNNVPAEGVVVTVEADQFRAYKLKSWAFFEGETKALDKGEVDIETEQSQ